MADFGDRFRSVFTGLKGRASAKMASGTGELLKDGFRTVVGSVRDRISAPDGERPLDGLGDRLKSAFSRKKARDQLDDDFDAASFPFERALGDYLCLVHATAATYCLTRLRLASSLRDLALAGVAQDDITPLLRRIAFGLRELEVADCRALLEEEGVAKGFGPLLHDTACAFTFCGIVEHVIAHDGEASRQALGQLGVAPSLLMESVTEEIAAILREEVGEVHAEACARLALAQRYRVFLDDVQEHDGGDIDFETGSREERLFDAYCAQVDALWEVLDVGMRGPVERARARLAEALSGRLGEACRVLLEAARCYAGRRPGTMEALGRHCWACEREWALATLARVPRGDTLPERAERLVARATCEVMLEAGDAISPRWRACVTRVRDGLAGE